MLPPDTRVFVALEPVNLHASFDTLSGLVRNALGHEPRSGSIFVFFNRPRNRFKALFFDGSGLCILSKRLDRGRFAKVMVPGERAILIPVDSLMTLIREAHVRSDSKDGTYPKKVARVLH